MPSHRFAAVRPHGCACRSASSRSRAASQALLEASGGKNLSETMWLRSEIAEIDAKLAG